MKKILLAVALGAVLGVGDGLSAWFTPDARPKLAEIVFLSTIKDVVAGFLIGVFAALVKSKSAVILWGLAVGLGLAFWVASQPDPETGKHYYAAIMLPGGLVGLIVGFATQRFAGAAQSAQSTATVKT